MRPEVARLRDEMRGQGYIAERSIVTAVHLARAMEKPLLVEGDAGVGKTEIAKVMAAIEGTDLIRLQCYEGLDVNTALYEWNYQKQLLRLRMAADERRAGPPSADGESLEDVIFGRDYLLERPLLRAIARTDGAGAAVLLIDEIDRADEGFEAFLLEVLSDFTVTVPELGTITAARPPLVVVTSNRTRDVHDALKRRCLYHWVAHPSVDREVEIVKLKLPDVDGALARQVASAVSVMREMRLYKPPGVAETIDWATALGRLGAAELDTPMLEATLGTVLKYREDIEAVRGEPVRHMLNRVRNREGRRGRRRG